MEKAINIFLNTNYGDGNGNGDGDGNGYGYGYGDGNGSGNCSVYGYGYGYGDGNGYGYGYGDGNGILSFNNQKVYLIDNIQTIISSIKNNICSGFIVNDDLTLTKTFVAKVGNFFAHGKSIKDALRDATDKYNNNLPIEQRIANFIAKYKLGVKYTASILSNEHKILTDSCEQGRLIFMKNHNIKLTDKLTVEEFINITKNDYGGNIIKELAEKYNNKTN